MREAGRVRNPSPTTFIFKVTWDKIWSNYFRMLLNPPSCSKLVITLLEQTLHWEKEVFLHESDLCLTSFCIFFAFFMEAFLCTPPPSPWETANFLPHSASQPDRLFLFIAHPSHSFLHGFLPDNIPLLTQCWAQSPSPWPCVQCLLSQCRALSSSLWLYTKRLWGFSSPLSIVYHSIYLLALPGWLPTTNLSLETLMEIPRRFR